MEENFSTIIFLYLSSFIFPQNMKMPNNESNEDDLFDYEETTYYLETIENNMSEELNNSQDIDFSEYFWMENEEEFDKEVMQRLEEEALMEECIEAMLADEANQANFTDIEIANMLNNLKLDNAQAVKESKLNPLAAEFIPSGLLESVDTPTGSS